MKETLTVTEVTSEGSIDKHKDLITEGTTLEVIRSYESSYQHGEVFVARTDEGRFVEFVEKDVGLVFGGINAYVLHIVQAE